MLRPYATPNDLPDTTRETLGDTTERALALASRIITRHIRRARYTTDQHGNPTDPTIKATLMAATCAQVVAWAEAGITADILTGGATASADVASSTMNGATVHFDNTGTTHSRAHIRAGALLPEAELILWEMGLLNAAPPTVVY